MDDDDDDEGRRRSAGLVAVPSFKPPDRVWGASERVKTTPKKRLVWFRRLSFQLCFPPPLFLQKQKNHVTALAGATLQRKTERSVSGGRQKETRRRVVEEEEEDEKSDSVVFL
jgi:hypothetical protein